MAHKVSLLLAPVAWLAMCSVLPGCPSDEACGEPAYGGSGNDEVWVTLSDARERASEGGKAATAVVPAADQVFPAQGAPPTFEWTSPLKLGPVAREATVLRRRGVERGTLGALLDLASRALVPPARAHLPPVSSDAYLVELAVPGRACPVAIVTTELTHALDDMTWDLLRDAAGADLTLTITSAYLASGRISEGPFRSAPVTFRVE